MINSYKMKSFMIIKIIIDKLIEKIFKKGHGTNYLQKIFKVNCKIF